MISCCRTFRTPPNNPGLHQSDFARPGASFPTLIYTVRLGSPAVNCSGNLTAPSVESDYTVVFFAAGGRNTPGWNWVWKAYRSLSRKYRKNLKRLVCGTLRWAPSVITNNNDLETVYSPLLVFLEE